MSESQIRSIIDDATFVVDGYAFSKNGGNVSVVCIFPPYSAMLMSNDGVMLETNMPPAEQALVISYWHQQNEERAEARRNPQP